jgi:hypothetical protein
MAKVTLIFAALLIALGLIGFLGTGGAHFTALIPSYFGLALLTFGFLAISPNESRRKLYMHVNVSIGLLGFLGGAIEAVRGYFHATSAGLTPNPIALTSKILLAGLMFIYVLLCVRSFINARRTGKV